MIKPDFKARLECDTEGCKEYLQIRLVLLLSGAFSPDIPMHAIGKWQLLGDPRNPLSPFKGKCPLHAGNRVELAGPVSLA